MSLDNVFKFLKEHNVEENFFRRANNKSRTPCRDFLQVWGLPRTGTNFVACLMQDNFNIFLQNGLDISMISRFIR